ncbi:MULTISPECIES: TetR/AcrR family transcriptional regulator [Mycobacteriaceae]|uniref:TetR/AcrR family transcriptional regulator n=13 Tax=Mycobacteriaceae TaxID=1762 RepID=A0A4R5PEF8_9MYCO|nr:MULTISPECIES: TetR/AcrR family transcriptional regulator [Mycobacteriaceae]ABP47067.1 transcriptional regulator, TetR family [Mycolicibacterium gilvum PYR-GCK]NVN49076.1 Transcriptional regulator, AcrR family [Mycolicibacterium hippocampi]ANE78898.1 TetR family transcriptional regulator [Mycobacterium adipatum]MDO3634818.1 TetR/AcrR family transcriptional regulator [Mycolicibacterium arseniciresistens]MDX1887586.1 TetR/AcrR family transcriptional regulator [Mycolicibacterium sp. 120270]
MNKVVVAGRTRVGGERRERILASATELIAERGYHAVSMADIGVASGVVGPAIYRHFNSKSDLLAALFERVVDKLLKRATAIVEQSRDEAEALTLLVSDQVALVMDQRELAMVYYREVHNLSDQHQSRLRRKQRLYLEEWVHLVGELRPAVDEIELRAMVHGAIGAIQSILHYRGTGLAPEQTSALLVAMGHAVLGVPASSHQVRGVNTEPSCPRPGTPQH